MYSQAKLLSVFVVVVALPSKHRRRYITIESASGDAEEFLSNYIIFFNNQVGAAFKNNAMNSQRLEI